MIMRLILILVLITTFFHNLYSQEKFSKLINAYDNHNYIQVDLLLDEVEAEINSLNATQVKLFELIKLFRKDNLLEEAIPDFERTIIKVALNKTMGRKKEAAELLGWGRNTLTRKIKELGLDS